MATAAYYNLGNHGRTISTTAADAQIWFDRGLNWTYAFNQEEAIRCFEQAAGHDPDCPMAYWGMAYAAGPWYNKPWDKFDRVDLAKTVARAYAATERAVDLLDKASPTEQALINALQSRYQAAEPVDDMSRWTEDYAEAMRFVYRTHSGDLDVVTLFAEALLNRTPWKMWNLRTGEPAEGASTLEAREVLEEALELPESQIHPGVLHMYIHLMEMSPYPEKAMRAADWMRNLVPDAGHLQHMPTHIDVLCGHYQDVVRSNHDAVLADREFIEREGTMNFYTRVRAHNTHFKMYGALFLGQYDAAMDAADEMLATTPEALLRMETPPMADWLEGYMSLKVHVYIRFGKWQKLIDMPLLDDQDLYCVTTAMIHYAKGVAYAATGRIDEAEQQKALFDDAVSRVPATRYLHNNTCLDLLAIGAEMLNGELEYRKGNYEEAFAYLRKSIELDDNLPYDEPWGWMQPTRHAYGALLLEQGRIEDAEEVYRADLGLDDTLGRAFQHPENVWSLHGYHECLVRRGKHELAKMIKQRLDLAAARADVPIESSCYCRLNHAA